MSKQIQLPIHHMKHALVDDFELVFNSGDNTLVDSQMHWHMNSVIFNGVFVLNLYLFFLCGVPCDYICEPASDFCVYIFFIQTFLLYCFLNIDFLLLQGVLSVFLVENF